MRVGSPFASFPRSRVVQGLGQSPGGQARTAPPPGSAVNSPSPCRPALRGLGCDLGYERGVHLPQGPLLGVDGSREEGVPELRPSHKRERQSFLRAALKFLVTPTLRAISRGAQRAIV